MKLLRLWQPLLVLSAATTATGAFAADPQVDVQTSLGTIRLELYPGKAPKTVENFLQYVRDGHYNGTVFHRVIGSFMIQGGGFDTNFRQKPTRAPIRNEAEGAVKAGLKNEIGTIAMARTNDPNSATAQFFINVANNAFLNWGDPRGDGNGYAVFGKVVAGMDVVTKIAHTPTGAGGPFPRDVPRQQVVIESMTVVGAK
jgi:peptidyl-prolyl cis-trans isomerase A (cyclophilin A)/peptidyl-prolyl cis-trans isomerase B (cyclophilin B)